MKRVLMLCLGLTAVVFCLTGCKSSYRDGGADYLYRPKPTGTPGYYTEYEVSNQRVSGAAESAVLFWFFQFSEGKYCLQNSDPNLSFLDSIFKFFSPTQFAVENAKKAALFNALSEVKADQLLGASFEYTITDYIFFSRVTCSAKGFPALAKCVKFHEKVPVILNKWQKIEYIAPQEYPIDYSDKVSTVGLSKEDK